MSKSFKEVQNEMRQVYKMLDRKAVLYWSHEDRILGKRLRSENLESAELDYKCLETAQVGYGEISLGSTQQMFNIMMQISALIYKNSFLQKYIQGNPEDYNLGPDSYFLDIGSGFGKPNFHASLISGCSSMGIEVVPVRAKVSEACLYDWKDQQSECSTISDIDFKESSYPSECFNTVYTVNFEVSLKNDTDFVCYWSKPKWQQCLLEGNLLDRNINHSDAFSFPLTRLLNCLMFNETVPNKEFSSFVNCANNEYFLDLLMFLNVHLNVPAFVDDEVAKLTKRLNRESKYALCVKGKSKNTSKKAVKQKKSMEEADLEEDNTFVPLFPIEEMKAVMNGNVYFYRSDWVDQISFICEDATAFPMFTDLNGKHFTHIYSYNKLMAKSTRDKIVKVLNKTNFKILAWYSNPKVTKDSGLKNVELLCKYPMQSTSTEKFYIYFYIKLKKIGKGSSLKCKE